MERKRVGVVRIVSLDENKKEDYTKGVILSKFVDSSESFFENEYNAEFVDTKQILI